MHNRSVALLCATLAAALTAGCGGHSSSRSPSASTAAAATSQTIVTLTPERPFEVARVSYSGESVWIEFSEPATRTSVFSGLRVYEDTDLEPGGEFQLTAGGPWLDPSGRILVLTMGRLAENELRVQLTDEVQSVFGRSLEPGPVGDAISAFSEPGVAFEYRFHRLPPSEPGAVARNTGDDHGQDAGSATVLVQSADGAIEAAADRDWFAVDLLGGREVTIRTETSGDTILNLYDGGSRLLATNDDDPNGGRHSRIAQTVPADGRYYVEVRGYADQTPTYRVFAEGAGARQEAGSTIHDALLITLDQTVQETLGALDRDHYALDLPAGTPIRAEADHADVALIALDERGRAFADPVHVVASGETLGRIANQYGIDYLELARLNGIDDPNRIEIGQRIHVPQAQEIEANVPASGRIYVLALGFAGATPSYTFGVRGPQATQRPPTPRSDDHGQSAAGATAFTLGTSAQGTIEAAGDADWFAVTLQDGKVYELATVTQGDSILSVLDASGAELAKNDDDPNGGRHSSLVYRATRDGTHYLAVTGYGSATLSYELQAAERAPDALPNPSRFRLRSGADPWHIDFRLRADLFQADLASHGLSSGDAATDRLMRDRVIDELLSFLSQKFKLAGDGSPIRGRSWKICFTATDPPGTAGRSYSREAVGGTHEDGSRTLGVSYLDPGNRRKEDNDDLGRLGIFSASIDGRDSTLRPALTIADKKFLDGTYLLGDGSANDDRRFRRVRQVASDWAHALAVVTAHEVGHSVGLDHDESHSRGIMKAALSSSLLSDHATRFADASAKTLDDSLGND